MSVARVARTDRVLEGWGKKCWEWTGQDRRLLYWRVLVCPTEMESC